MNKQKIILTDVDEVLLQFADSFIDYVKCDLNMDFKHDLKKVYHLHTALGIEREESRKILKNFTQTSPRFSNIDAYPDAVENVKRLTAEGYIFVAITAIDYDPLSYENRFNNIKKMYGDCIKDLHLVGVGGEKLTTLKKYDPTFFIDDQPKHTISGIEAGHKSIIIDRLFNQDFEHPEVYRANDWHQIYDYIKNNQ